VGPQKPDNCQAFFIMFYCYILYSDYLDRFYIGATSLDPEERLDNHLLKYYGRTKFSAKADDWVLYFSILCSSFKQASAIETHIKRMKSKQYIRNLKSYPELSQKLLELYPDS
jgi:putative endonuclease